LGDLAIGEKEITEKTEWNQLHSDYTISLAQKWKFGARNKKALLLYEIRA
jgi:hypothetical protein